MGSEMCIRDSSTTLVVAAESLLRGATLSTSLTLSSIDERVGLGVVEARREFKLRKPLAASRLDWDPSPVAALLSPSRRNLAPLSHKPTVVELERLG